MLRPGLLLGLLVGAAVSTAMACAGEAPRRWLAGDHHVHSRFSGKFVGAVGPEGPPIYALGVDGRYPIPVNAAKARRYGLAWIAATDHGGLSLSHLRYEQEYPELLASRRQVPDLIQFWGLELDTPGGDHSSLILPITPHEREDLRRLEAAYGLREVAGGEAERNATPLMLEALGAMERMSPRPVVIANHPSRSSAGPGRPLGHTLQELRLWNDAAPDVAVGMEGAPGHQAAALKPAAARADLRGRGFYDRAPTLGGFDEMTAQVGGAWDVLLGEGRRWWITANSDSHHNHADGGEDFWPGEYSKTYVYARRDADDILDGLRRGRVFVTTGDLISELDLAATAGGRAAGMGDTLEVPRGGAVRLSIRVRDPAARNAAGRRPQVRRIDVIVGEVRGRGAAAPARAGARVVRRFTARAWRRRGEILTMSLTLPPLAGDAYVRIRGTDIAEPEPAPDRVGENPWDDLWFYSNPIFLTLSPRGAETSP
ncbi:MAG: phosphoesterase [Caulobacteraceae bacterium]